MRSDMAKVIVERPRSGGGCRFPRGSITDGQRVQPEDLRKREGIRRPWKSWRKHLNENLAPLRRFLRSNVGRPWNKVYSEVCERINRDSAVQYHVWQHLMQDVCRDPYVISGEVRAGWPFGRAGRLYVDPRTGLLRESRKSNRSTRPSVQENPDRIALDPKREYRRIDAIWYEIELSPLPGFVAVYDLVLKRTWPQISTRELTEFYGRRVYASGKRQLNKREIRRLPLTA